MVEQPDLLLGRHWIIWNPNVLQLEKIPKINDPRFFCLGFFSYIYLTNKKERNENSRPQTKLLHLRKQGQRMEQHGPHLQKRNRKPVRNASA